ncbi:MAG: hypothetical protein V1863_06550 [Candidatus Omnitrophota bacterium]
MKNISKKITVGFLGFLLLAASAPAQQVQEVEDLLKNLNTQIEEARTQLDKKKLQAETKQEERTRRELKREALRKHVSEFRAEADQAFGQKRYDEAAKLYEQLIILDPRTERRSQKRINDCKAHLAVIAQDPLQDVDSEQLRLARQLAVAMEEKDGEGARRQTLVKASELKQHMSMGDFYLKEKNYSKAIDAYRQVLAVMPENRRAQKRISLAKKRLFASKARQVVVTGSLAENIEFRHQLIQEGFQEALKLLKTDDYVNAQQEFRNILDYVAQLSLENGQRKTAEEIKQGARQGPESILSDIRQDKYDEAKKKIWDLIQKTADLARQKETDEKNLKNSVLINGYLKNASTYLKDKKYQEAKREVRKALVLEPEHQEAHRLLERIEDIVFVMQGAS